MSSPALCVCVCVATCDMEIWGVTSSFSAWDCGLEDLIPNPFVWPRPFSARCMTAWLTWSPSTSSTAVWPRRGAQTTRGCCAAGCRRPTTAGTRCSSVWRTWCRACVTRPASAKTSWPLASASCSGWQRWTCRSPTLSTCLSWTSPPRSKKYRYDYQHLISILTEHPRQNHGNTGVINIISYPS